VWVKLSRLPAYTNIEAVALMHQDSPGPTPPEQLSIDFAAPFLDDFDHLVQRVRSYHPDPDLSTLERAFRYAAEKHHEQRRKSGEPYIIHPLGVAEVVAQLKLDIASLCAALLHDVVEDTPTTLDELRERFGAEVATLVDGLTKLSKLRFSTHEEHQAENFRKMIVAMSQDIRIILIKLADRLHNMRTLEHMREQKRFDIAQETSDIYAPLANRLGIGWMRSALQDLSLRFLHAEEYVELEKKVERVEVERGAYIEEVIEVLEKVLTDQGMKGFTVQGRPKAIYSIYRKMKRSNVEFEQLYDLLAFRILVDNVSACYAALGYVHMLWHPIPGRFKDYIALPKPNMYQSLHTSVLGPYRERIEIQIRTFSMHQVAEEGIAAHWLYKEGRISPGDDERKFAWLRQLVEWQQDVDDPKEFLDTVKIDLFPDEVYVFTPRSEVKSFPKGATPIDFAYSVHSEIGHHCAGAKVNGAIVPLKYQLCNGDIVSIITNPNQRPKQDWLQYTVTSRARTKIKQFVRKEQRDRSREIGQQLLEKSLKRVGMTLVRLEKSPELEKMLRAYGASTLDDVLVNVGLGKLQPEAICERFTPKESKEDEGEADARLDKLLNRIKRRSQTGISVDGVDDIMVRFAKCCTPVPGEPIIGFVTRGRGVTVHAKSCTKIDDMELERQIDCHWDARAAATELKRAVNVRVVCADKPGMLTTMTQCFTGLGINITQAHCRTTEEGRAINAFEVLVKDVKQLQNALKSLARIPGVYSAERVIG
jgi:GTP pyrophosphokinase